MADLKPLPVISLPGIKRDGTRLQGENYVDGLWMRFERGLPRKMKGYERLTNLLPEKVYGMNVDELGDTSYVHVGSSSRLSQFDIALSGAIGVITNRTPSGFTADADNCWQMDVIFDSISGTPSLIAHGAPNLLDPLSETDRDVYIGELTAATPLVQLTTSQQVSGGVVVLHPYLVVYGNNGYLNWSVPNEPGNFSSGSGGGGTGARIAEDKILKGLPLRGGPGNSPAGMFWSVRSLLRMSFVGGAPVFDFDTLSHNIAVMSAASIIEYDSVYYWPGVDRFYVFDGVLRELQNEMNRNWFFDGINYDYRGKCFAYSVPRWGEIWWCYPRGTATECTHAIIFNVREGSWYDTPLPQSGRSAAGYSQIHRSPLLTGVAEDATTEGYNLWRHEVGVDEVVNGQSLAIKSYFTTNAYFPAEKGEDVTLFCERIEPDFVQSGNMTAYIIGQPNARATPIESDPRTFPEVATDRESEAIYFREARRQMNFKFESNEAGGDYQMGQVMAYVDTLTGRRNT